MNQRTDNEKFVNNLITLHSNIIQILSQKYLEDENKGSDVYMYPELINDIDVFSKRIESIQMIHDNFASKNPSKLEPKTVQVFLKLIEDDESQEYALRLKNLVQIINIDFEYPKTTTVELILVPSDRKDIPSDDPLYSQINQFVSIKKQFEELSDDEQYLVINSTINDTGSYKENMNMVLLGNILDAKHGKLIKGYSKDISIDRFHIIKNNLLKIRIRVITIKELLTVSITTEYMSRLLFPLEKYEIV